ncbi:MAG TPA: phytanoyl-CoA dioxygenase family protein, partial [Kribbella sp.]|uniref:phytanoyl-CoA dioxygenase family protein n=1 Tax=Kribbella sp. TaxID=1871183 RepID=UPI002D79C88D
MTNTDLKSQYDRDGFVVLDHALNPGEVGKLLEEAVRIARGELGPIIGELPVDAADTDEEVLRRYLCIHYPHKFSDLMLATMRHPAIVSALTKLIGPNVKAMQSMLFIKSEGKPGQAWHQDEMFIPTRDRSLTAAWIALDDATTENGCLWVL